MSSLYLWKNFEKRKNSTKQPLDASRTTLSNVYLKEGTSLEQPVFIINSNDFTYNYAQYNGIYYYIDDIVSLKNNLLELHCSRDLLATYKAKIQATSPYVLYYDHTNTEIVDSRLSTKTTQVTQSENGAFSNFGKGTCYVLSVVGQDSVSQYAVSLSDLKGIVNQNFLDTLENQISQVNPPATDSLVDFATYITDLLTTEALSFTYVGKISECIRSCYALPIPYTAWGGSSEQIYLGKSYSGKSGYALGSSERILSDSATVNIPWQASDWRRNAPYHEIYLYIPCIGVMQISPSDVMGETAIHVDMSLDKLSGDVIINVGTASKVISQFTTNVAIDYPIGYSNVDPSMAATSVAGALGAISGAVNPAVGAVVAGLGITNVIQPQAQSIGSNGGGAFLGLVGYTGYKVYCFTIFHDTTVAPSNPSAAQGTPYNGVMSLSGISGYVQTAGASVEVGGFGNDKDIINSYLNGGIYIE